MIPLWPIIKGLLPIFGILLVAVLIKFAIELIYYRYFYDEGTTEETQRKPTREAVRLSDELSKLGYRTELEKWDGHKHVDIAVTQARLNIEIDGSYHNYRADIALRDLERTYYSLEKGFVTIRIPNSLVRYRLPQTVIYLDKILKCRVNKNIT